MKAAEHFFFLIATWVGTVGITALVIGLAGYAAYSVYCFLIDRWLRAKRIHEAAQFVLLRHPGAEAVSMKAFSAALRQYRRSAKKLSAANEVMGELRQMHELANVVCQRFDQGEPSEDATMDAIDSLRFRVEQVGALIERIDSIDAGKED